MDRESLRDAIDAEHLAACLRAPELFYTSQYRVSEAVLQQYARARGEVVRRTLSASDADVQWGFEQVMARWKTVSPSVTPVRIISVLAAYAANLLYLDGAEMVLRVDGRDPGREILRWRFVSLAIPQGLLIAAATPMGVRPPSAVRLLHRVMAPDTPVAHQHVHHAAMLSFEELWASLRLRALLRPGRYWDAFAENRAFCPGLHRGRCIGSRAPADRDLGKQYPYARRKHLIEWAAMIRLALFARGLLQRHLQHLGELSKCAECRSGRNQIGALTQGRSLAYPEATRPYPWPDELVALRWRERQEEQQPSRSGFPAHIAAEEQIFLVRAFDYVAPDAPASVDELFEKVLLQYLRVKAAVFGLLVHPPGEPGLEKFLDHFLQIKVYAPEADRAVPRPPDEPGLQVGATEYRVAPDAWFRARRRQEIETLVRGKTPRSRESGFLIHFKRKKGDGTLPLHGSSVRSMDAEADQIMRYMEAQPEQLKKLRGVDICGVEEAQPCWVVADTLRRLRRRSEEIVARSGRRGLQPLRLTLHAGEDFEWLTTGVRAMAEPFAWNLFRRGDRIGHGIAITLDPKKWWRRKSRDVVQVNWFDCFLNLAFLAEYVPDANRDQREWLRESLIAMVRRLGLDYGGARPPLSATDPEIVDTARLFWRSLGMPVLRRIIASPSIGIAGGHRHLQWLHRYLWNRSIHERGEEKVSRRLEGDRGLLPIASDHNELDLLIEARKRVIHDLARWQICIESNPSSNLLVGSLDSLMAQDFLHRRPASSHGEGDETLMWSISTDDPITFSTSLADEYAYAWAGMVLRKDKRYDPAYARALLDEAAATSMRTRFTIPRDDKGKRNQRRDGHQRR